MDQPGSLIAIVLWLIASAAFAFYVANLSSSNKTYGSMAAIIIFLLWMWISNLATLLSLEFNAELELERARANDSGHTPGESPTSRAPRHLHPLTSTPGWCAGLRDVGTRSSPRIRHTGGRGPSAGKDTPTA
ncbi:MULTISPECIES: YihY/virulence factor BrkB family protein [Streptomyces]|uniref:YihY/virulence factor BrkB family protein n=1 Tax=Streptomyces TaxID=1883 RepID=UPI0027E404A9|nr:YihY/virulence factor BrkB family protein [Streptomyces sp. GbtcB7]